MPSVKPFSGYVFAGAALCVSAASIGHAAPHLVINNASVGVQTPSAAPGISYKATGANAASLTVYSEGFPICANVGEVPPATSIVTLVPRHEEPSPAGPHAWTFPTAIDTHPVGYRNGVLSINRDGGSLRLSTLACLAVGADGAIGSGLAEGIFDSDFGSPTSAHFEHMVNWVPPTPPLGGEAFDWTKPADWSLVPADPCSQQGLNPRPRVAEDVACVAATGVRSSGQKGGAVRAPTMWTAVTKGTQFTYVFRVDATLIDTGAGSAKVAVRDAFDGTYLGATGGNYCFLQDLPATLGSSVCGASAKPLDGQKQVLNVDVPLGNVDGSGHAFAYLAVTRPIVGGPQVSSRPVVGAAVFLDPAAAGADVGGDKFIGDNVVFGFMPGSTGFPWMSASNNP